MSIDTFKACRAYRDFRQLNQRDPTVVEFAKDLGLAKKQDFVDTLCEGIKLQFFSLNGEVVTAGARMPKDSLADAAQRSAIAEAIPDSRFTAQEHQQVQNATVAGDILQIINNYYEGTTPMSSDNRGGNSKQSAEDVKISGAIKQSSDAQSADQQVKKASATSLDQTAHSEKQHLAIGKWKASGKWAVIAVVVIAVVTIIFKFLAK
jgi:hypothetical protein